ncbi:SdpI family protein [soil metagenome]
MTRPFSVLNMLTVLVFVAIAGIALMIAVQGPTVPLPVHFNTGGGVDRWGDRSEVGGLLAGLAAIGFVISLGIGWQASRHEAGSSRSRSLRAAQVVILIAFAAITGLILFTSLGGRGAAPPAGGLMAGTSLLCAAVGAFLGRVGPNPFVGVRTPWAYKSRLSWDRSNRLAGRLFFFGGLAGLVAAPFAPQPLGMSVLIAGVIVAAGWSAFESWRVWRADPDRQPF